MICLGFNGCQDAHPSALDYFLAVLVVLTAVAAARLLACAVARCLCGDGAAAAHLPHHHHHDHSPSTSDLDEDYGVGPWGGGGLAIFGQPGHVVPPLPSGGAGWWPHGRSTRATSLTPAH
ncbi:unnamed protein product [Urochloa decumbens]|uniref:Uncharacterized protein n=1 Tax=Urochloa decumbens TaxID=240449 RepID=A0ABC9BFU9_9POAL